MSKFFDETMQGLLEAIAVEYKEGNNKMKKTYRVAVINETKITVDVEENISNEELLDKIEEELDKGYILDSLSFEIKEELSNDE